MNVERVKASEGDGTFKRIDDSWSVLDGDNWEKYSELYGQLYVFPQAEVLNLVSAYESLVSTITTVNSTFGGFFPTIPKKIKGLIKDLELPFMKGPAFPLFELARPAETSTGFTIESNSKNPFSAYFQSSEDNSYVVFANLWDSDGDGPLQFDDCFVKGNALGLERINFTSGKTYNMKRCDNDNISTSFHREKDITNDMEDGLQEYELTGTFDIYGTGDGGKYYEPSGDFLISIGSRSINENFVIWKVTSYIEVKENQHYLQPFVVRFRESKSFLDSPEQITLSGSVTEIDDTGDDLIGNYDGETIGVNVLSLPRTLKFEGDSGNTVSITLQLKPVIGNHTTELIDFVLVGVFDFWTTDDGNSDDSYEPYGDFTVDVGLRTENLNYNVWNSKRDDLSIHIGQHVTTTFQKNFKEGSNFLSQEQVDSKVVLHGTVKEADGAGNSDDVIGNYEGHSYLPSDLEKEPKSFDFLGDSSGVKITLQIRKASDIPIMVNYKFTVQLRMYCKNDGSGWMYEPIGTLKIDVGNRLENQMINVWDCNNCGLETEEEAWTVIDFDKVIQETDDFLDQDKSYSVTFHGKAWEDDGKSGDDLLGDYDGVSYLASEFTESKTKKFPGTDSQDETQIIVKIERADDSSYYSQAS